MSRRPALETLRELGGVAVWFSLWASSGELLVLAVRRYALDRPIYQSVDVLWAKPLVNAGFFLLAGVALWLAGVALPRLPRRLAVGVLAFLALLGPALVAVPGTIIPMAILCVGIATRLVARDRIAAIRVVGIGLAGMLVLANLLVPAASRLRDRGLAVGPPPGAPNVLLVILDTVRAASLGLYGGPRPNTPQLEALAQRGAVFDLAIAPSSWTLPAHASMFTGLWPSDHGADWRSPLGDGPVVLASVLSNRGYRTGGFVANLAYATAEHGLARGFQAFREHDRSAAALLRAAAIPERLQTSTVLRRLTRRFDIAGRKRAPAINAEFLAWQQADTTRPFFAFLNYFDAHEPYQPARPFAGAYSAGLPPRRQELLRFWNSEGALADWSQLSPGEVAAELAAYEESIAELDAHLGELFRELERRGQMERTLVIVASDHGEQFGEHGLYTHGNSLYWRGLHVPLVVAFPAGVPPGTRVAGPVSLRDIPATIMDAVAPGSASPFPGNSLLAAIRGQVRPSWVLSELTADPWIAAKGPTAKGDLRAITSRGWHYVRAANGDEELFPLSGREAASGSVAADPAWRAARDSAREALASVPPGRLAGRRP